MKDMSNRDKVCNVLNAHQKGECLTNEAIEQIADILGVEIESDIEFGVVFTGIFGKCVAMGQPDKQGHFFAYTPEGFRAVYHVSEVQEIHPSRTNQMQRIFTDIVPVSTESVKWYNKPIPDDFRDPDEYTNPADLYRL